MPCSSGGKGKDLGCKTELPRYNASLPLRIDKQNLSAQMNTERIRLKLDLKQPNFFSRQRRVVHAPVVEVVAVAGNCVVVLLRSVDRAELALSADAALPIRQPTARRQPRARRICRSWAASSRADEGEPSTLLPRMPIRRRYSGHWTRSRRSSGGSVQLPSSWTKRRAGQSSFAALFAESCFPPPHCPPPVRAQVARRTHFDWTKPGLAGEAGRAALSRREKTPQLRFK